MRLINADALIERLIESHKHHANNSREKALLDRDIQIVQEQPTVNDWIPCSERLPNREEYLKNGGCFIGYGRNKVYPVVFDIYTRKFCNYTYFGFLVDDNSIKRWQPLPKPYKGE